MKTTPKRQPFVFTREELISENRWPDHDPGDEDPLEYLHSPVAPSRSLLALVMAARAALDALVSR